jgi:hypothetical protein
MKTATLFAPLALLLATACASVPIPTAERSASEAACRGAKEAGAEATPQARLAMQLSLDENAQANQFVLNGENAQGAALYDRARADAELAIGLSRETQMELAAQQAAQAVAALRASAP